MSFGIFGVHVRKVSIPVGGKTTIDGAPAIGKTTVTKDAGLPKLSVGDRVRGADVVPYNYLTVTSKFRGHVVSFEPGDNVRVKMEGTKRIFKVSKQYLVKI